MQYVLGGVISHDFKMKFCSPTVNQMIPANEFVSLIENLDNLNGCFRFQDSDKMYPVGLLNDKYTVHFIHYKTFSKAVDTWKRRLSRMDYSEMYFILVETASCSYEDLVKFDSLPYEHKIALVHKNYPEIKSARVIKGFDGKNLHGEILSYQGLWGKRMYDQINWADFLNLGR